MNKQLLISKISEVTGFSKKDSEIFVGAFTGIVVEAVANGDKVQLVGFGNFEKKPTKGTTGIIRFGDRKGETWTSEDSFRVGFKVGKEFADLVKQ